ncbi:hypothetical protein [Streptomyces sp. NPDC056056]|uniref:hypothetical protein n=1 Tax=Streptomyces sp. NPDC056056 TaxID=3345698 RepID=UPI0035D9032C
MQSTERRPAVRTDSYWALLQSQADSLVSTGRQRRDDAEAAGTTTMKRLLNLGYGPGTVLDLSAVVVLALIKTWPDHARDDQGRPELAALRGGRGTLSGTPVVLQSGPYTMTERPTRQQVQRARELEQAVAKALSVDPTRRIARSAARRALAAYGTTVRDTTGIYATVSDLVACLGPATPDNS